MSTAHGIQGETGMFSASDLADWFDDGEEQFWRQQDDWLIEQQDLGNAHPVLVFAAWFSDRAASAPQRGLHSLSAGVVDVLRLGSDIDPSDSAFNIGKGVFANVTRLLTLAGPIAEGLGVGARYAGLMAETQLTKLRGVPGPCRFVSLDRALTFARGKKVQLFAALDDVAKVRPPGMRRSGISVIEEILEHPSIAPLISEAGIAWRDLGNLNSMEKVIEAAKRSSGALTIGLRWLDRAGKARVHRLAVVKNALNEVVFLESHNGKITPFKSLAEISKTIPSRQGIENAVLRPHVMEFVGKKMKLLEAAGSSWHLGLPVAVGVRWKSATKLDDAAFDILKSVWTRLKEKLGSKAPPPPEELKEAPKPQAGPPPEAAKAPRPDWLTGVQYRLAYLAYYKGPIHGVNDRPTREGVIAFQTDQQIMIDGIPGPQTQGELVRVCGF